MPYRHVSPHRRPWWEILTGVWFALFVFSGVCLLVDPPAAIGYGTRPAQAIFAVALVALGFGGFAAWWRGRRAPEIVFMRWIAAVTFAHGCTVIILDEGGLIDGLRIIAAAAGTLSWAGIRHEFGLPRRAVEEAVELIGDMPPGRTE